MTKTLTELADKFIGETIVMTDMAWAIRKFVSSINAQGYKVVKEECEHEWTNPDSNCQHSYCVHCRIIEERPQPKKIEPLRSVIIYNGDLKGETPPDNRQLMDKINQIIDHLNK